MSQPQGFLFVTCQVGAEKAVKNELARRWPDFRFAYSRPGFLTFKLPPAAELPDDFDLGSVFARSYGFSLGKVQGEDVQVMARQAVELAPPVPFDVLHVWPRDTAAPGEHAFQPGFTAESDAAESAIRSRWPADRPPLKSSAVARSGQLVLDCVLVEPGHWWMGYHRARSWASKRPGGLSRLVLPAEAVSRAYLKMEESLSWSRLDLEPGQRAVEIGCAPGGSCQALLKHGLLVKGIDPAAMHPTVLKHPNFVHVRKRGAEVARRELRGTRWLMADMNVAPTYTLDTIEAIVQHASIDVRGMILTLKLLDWELAEHVEEYLQRVRGWGFPLVRARQLQHNRQEICLVGLRKRPARRRRQQ